MLKLQNDSLEWALQHALKLGDTDVFPLPFEFYAIEYNWTEVKQNLLSENILTWKTRPTRLMISPKSRLGFRVVTQLDPLDFLVFCSLIYEIADDLEKSRLKISENCVFSYRVKTDLEGRLFDADYGYRKFIENCQNKLDTNNSINFIVTTDISDYYSRIYHHRLENSLLSATSKKNHVIAIRKLLSSWNETESHGIPIGSAPARLLAEINLNDIDNALLLNDIDFCRFNDDYRIFSTDISSAYQALTILADILNRNHGLTLQASKTNILNRNEFETKYLYTHTDKELYSLREKFDEIISDLVDSDWYSPIDYQDLSEDEKKTIDSLNLKNLIEEELEKEEPDLTVVKFILRRLSQLGDIDITDLIFENLTTIHPLIPDIHNYLENLKSLSQKEKSDLGNELLGLMEDSIIKELPFAKMWLLNLFSSSNEWNNQSSFVKLLNAENDINCRRKLILAMGKAHHTHWFQSQWKTLFDHPHWTRRAVLAGASCLPTDARKHLYNSLRSKLDLLEISVAKWANKFPF